MLQAGGCCVALSAKNSPAIGELSAQVKVHDEALTLHLASPRTPVRASTPLVLYASGDGGCFGAAVGMFHTIANNGLPTVGFSTKAFMRIEQRWSGDLRSPSTQNGKRSSCAAATSRAEVLTDKVHADTSDTEHIAAEWDARDAEREIIDLGKKIPDNAAREQVAEAFAWGNYDYL